jgi:Flp pilus assembly protein TadD
MNKNAAVQIEQNDTFDNYVIQGRRLLEQKQFDKAQMFIRKASQIEPERPEPFNLLGVMSELRGDIKAANRMYRVALALDSAYKPAISNLQRVSEWRRDSSHIDFGDLPEEKKPFPLKL